MVLKTRIPAPRRGSARAALALFLAASTAPALAARLPAREIAAPQAYEPADSLEGNFLAAYIAGASRDTAAAATYYREAVKGIPATPNSSNAPSWPCSPTVPCRRRSAPPSG